MYRAKVQDEEEKTSMFVTKHTTPSIPHQQPTQTKTVPARIFLGHFLPFVRRIETMLETDQNTENRTQKMGEKKCEVNTWMGK